MIRARLLVLLAGLLLVGARPACADDNDLNGDELKLQALGLNTDGPSLLALFKQRSRSFVPSATISALVKELGNPSAEARRKAMGELISLGPVAIPALRLASSDPDAMTLARAARRCLQAVEGEEARQISVNAVRLLGERRPEGTVDALLDYLPFVEDDDTRTEILNTLTDLAYDRNEKPNPALLQALQDSSALKRATAVEVLCASGIIEPRALLGKLMLDPKPIVRLQAALALAQVKDPKAISTLILLLAELPEEQARKAEEFLGNLAGEQAPAVSLRGDDSSRQKARDAWAHWWMASEQPNTLLDEFRKRTMSEEDRLKSAQLIADLGADDFERRESSEKTLKTMGVMVLPLLRKALKGDEDPEVRDRARRCLETIEKNQAGPLSIVYPRLVAYRRPAGAVEVLLRFLPFAEDESTILEIQHALNVNAFKEGKCDPALLAALKDKLPIRRAAAAEALAADLGKHRDELHKLLNDPVLSVRAQVALALARHQDRTAVPVLINLLAELPSEESAHAEEFLAQLARTPPTLPGGTDEAARKKRGEIWAAWWKENGEKVAMALPRIQQNRSRYLGYTLVVSTSFNQVQEIGLDGKVRWQINGLNGPLDAVVSGSNRVLIVEANTRQLTERDFKGNVLWRVDLGQNIYPIGVQKLPNNNVLVVGNNQVVIYNRQGRQVFLHNRPNSDIMNAMRTRDGHIVCVTSSGIIYRLDASGKEVKSYRYSGSSNYGIDVLSNGNVLYPVQHQNHIYEVDGNGQQVWQASVVRPLDVQRLPSGNTLVASYSPNQVVELDPKGKEVWKQTLTVQPQRIHRR